MTIDGSLLWGELGVLVSAVAGVCLHEAGHALAGQWVGLAARLIQIGTGPTLARWRIGRLVIVLHAWPLTGSVASLLRPGAGPRAYAIRIAGGPAANALLFGLAAAALAMRPDWDDALFPVLVIQGPLALLNLLPFRLRRKGQLRYSDGMQLLRCARGEFDHAFETSYQAAIAPVYPPGLPLPPPSPDAPELLFHVLRPDRWWDTWARNDAQEEVAMLVGTKRLTPPEQAVALHFLLTNELDFADTGTTDGWIRTWSGSAFLVLPEDVTSPPAVLLTRAGALARLGDGAGAEELLRLLLPRLRQASSLVSGHVYMAQAAALQGRAAEAAASLVQARAAAKGPARKALLLQIRRAERRTPLAPVDPAPDTAITRA